MGHKFLFGWLMWAFLLNSSIARSIEVIPAVSTWTPEFIVENLSGILFKKAEGTSQLEEATIFQVTLENNTVRVPNNGIPNSIFQAFDDMDDELKRGFLRRSFNRSDASLFAEMPVLLLSVMPMSILKAMDARYISTALRENPDNVALAEKLVAAIGASIEEQKEFLASLDNDLTSDVQQLIMQKLTLWWPDPQDWKTRLSLVAGAGNIMLADIPSDFLKSISGDDLTIFVDAVASASNVKTTWKRKTTCVKKCWYDAAVRAKYIGPLHLWDTKKTVKYSFLLESAPADTLRSLRAIDEDQKRVILSGRYSDIQIRALFDNFYAKTMPTNENLREFGHRIYALYPHQLQQFPFEDGEFRFATKNYGRKRFYFHPSALQVAYFLYPAQGQKPVEQWSPRELGELGHLLHLLPNQELRRINNSALDWKQRSINDVVSSHLTVAQTWMLMEKVQKGVNPRRDFPNYIRFIPMPLQQGIPTGVLIQNFLQRGSEESYPVLIKVMKGMLASQKQLVYHQIKDKFGDASVLRSILDSKSDNLMNMLPPNKTVELMTKLMKMTESFDISIVQKQEAALMQMPRRTLSTWMTNIRSELQRDWMVEDFLPRTSDMHYRADYTILGLTCLDVEVMGDLQLIPIVSKYRNVLAEVQKVKDVFFPIDLMHCMMKRLVMDFHLKKELVDFLLDEKDSTLSLMSKGEAMTLGPILALLPKEELMAVPPNTRLSIIEAIGTVDIPTLMSVTNINKLQWLATQYVKAAQAKNDFIKQHWFHNMGTLLTFCTPETKVDAEVGVLKEYLEMHDRKGDKMFCLNSTLRLFWQNVIQETFGPSTNWTGTEIMLLGDMLLWVSQNQLEEIPDIAMVDALSVWMEKSALTLKLVQQPGSLTSLLDACKAELHEDGAFVSDAFNKLSRKIIRAANAVVASMQIPQPGIEASHLRLRRQFLDMDSDFELSDDNDDAIDDNEDLLFPELSAAKFVKPQPNLHNRPVARLQQSGRLFPVAQSGQQMPLLAFGEGVNVTCETLKTIGPLMTALTNEELRALTASDFLDCLEHIGKQKWNKQTAKNIFDVVKLILSQSGSKEIPPLFPEVLLNLGSLVHEIVANDLDLLDFQLMGSTDTVAIMGQAAGNIREMQALARKFLNDNNDFVTNMVQSSPVIRTMVMASLGNIIGGLPAHEVLGVLNSQRGIYWEISPLLGQMADCSPEVLEVLADFAVSEYGDPSLWTADTVETIGIVMAGMKPATLLQLERQDKGMAPLQGLTVSAIRKMTPALLQSLSVDQLTSLPLSVAREITALQMGMLSPAQKRALAEIGKIPSFRTSFPISPESSTTTTTTTTPTRTTPLPKEAAREGSASCSTALDILLIILGLLPLTLF